LNEWPRLCVGLNRGKKTMGAFETRQCKKQEDVVLSIEIIEHLRREEEQRREELERPSLRIPVEQPPERMPAEPEQAAENFPVGTVITLDVSQDDVSAFTVATW